MAAHRPTGILQRTLVVAAFTFSVFPRSAECQADTAAPVRGRVLTSDGSPAKGALVELVRQGLSGRTSASGEFLFPNVSSGTQILRIRALGHVPKTEEILVSADSGWTGSIVLDRAPQQLQEVQITAPGKPPEFANTTKYDDYFRRRRIGQGTFRTREDIEKMGAANIASVLQGIPGVNVTLTGNPYGSQEMRFRMARCPGNPPNLAIYINGQKVAAFTKQSENRGSELSGLSRKVSHRESTCDDCARIAEVLSSVALPDILFVEFYRGPGQIPNDLDRGDSCAAIVIWTR